MNDFEREAQREIMEMNRSEWIRSLSCDELIEELLKRGASISYDLVTPEYDNEVQRSYRKVLVLDGVF